MIKLIIVTLILFAVFIQHNCAFDTDEYVAYIEKLSRDETFLEEYAAWSSELFSQPDYLYCPRRNKTFPCPIVKHTGVPTSVHALRPSDVKCVGALGDSLTAGLGAHAITPIGLIFENRGLSWSIGGDHTYARTLSLPNVLRKYNPDLEGFSTKVSVIFLKGQNATHNGLNVAKSGAESHDMPGQAELLVQRLKDGTQCDWNNDWKVITLFVGGNDLCSYCNDSNKTKYEPEQYRNNVRAALDILSTIPRTFVNLVLVLDVRGVEELNSGGLVCQLLHNNTCPCAAYPKEKDRPILERYIRDYQQLLTELVETGNYDVHDNFTVVVQPFMANTTLPRKANNKIDFSYFAPDCFHFSAKGHAEAAHSLWNNMLEPVGGKRRAWHTNEPFNCPSEEFPYIFTAKNSAKALEAYQRTTIAETTRANKPTRPELSATRTTKPARSTSEHHKHHKHHKSDSYWTKMNFTIFVGIFFVLVMILIVAMSKREKIRSFLHKTKRRHINGFTNPQYSDENDDVEIWNRSTSKTGFSLNNSLPKTHGARVILD